MTACPLLVSLIITSFSSNMTSSLDCLQLLWSWLYAPLMIFYYFVLLHTTCTAYLASKRWVMSSVPVTDICWKQQSSNCTICNAMYGNYCKSIFLHCGIYILAGRSIIASKITTAYMHLYSKIKVFYMLNWLIHPKGSYGMDDVPWPLYFTGNHGFELYSSIDTLHSFLKRK